MKFYKQPVNVSMLALVAGIAVLVIIGGYVVIQSIFRICLLYTSMMDSTDRPQVDYEAETLLSRISHRLERL